MKRSLYWVTNDLRLNDNIALNLASQSEQLLCVYVVDKKWFEPKNYQSKPLGDKRWHFLQGCLSDFNQSLLALDQQLYIVYGDTLSSLTALCEKYDITDVITTRLPGTYENSLIDELGRRLPEADIHQVDQFTLFPHHVLPFELEQLPISYSKFRKVMADISIADVTPSTQSLPSMFANMPSPTIFRPSWLPNTPYQRAKCGYNFEGGETAGLKQLSRYFSSALPADYKQVRNNLDGWDNSSKLSAWLNYGCISARQVNRSITDFEEQQGENSSTQCLYLELLWREYFQWLHFKVGAKTYQFKGLAEHPPLTSFYPERFNKWCLGQTPYPLVNACMNELMTTGYISNRARQIVASCLVNELSVDWRFGAAWFEEQLIDYDAGVNWGNWQYIAGVGVDPRGGRHFNIEKQTALYDSDGVYQAKWVTRDDYSSKPLDSVDASDWPVQPLND
ncbi:DASH family cryptochrome [Colwellia sp. BRX8-7]|uniref:DASH family cryptochrome n=1 Tax=Colwellia sp. BRX8-7 TaxID=2759833 RepID=UPI0015F6CA5F|nr:DASH family cryptochrome [Colwellia sp. BRX8-7]MBA6336938.1 DASH family cryptochrome [Colwellia sp. BRX8-7]